MSMVETAPSKIQVRNLNFYYGKFHALKNINLDIAKNQVTAFMYLGELIEFSNTDDLFTKPAKKQTEDYITGRYG